MEGQSGHSSDKRRHFCWSEGQGRPEAAGAPVACSQGEGGGDAGARAVHAGPARMGLTPPGAPRTCLSGTLLPSGGRQRGVPCAGFTGGCRSEAEVGLRWSWFEVTVESRDPWASPRPAAGSRGPGTHSRRRWPGRTPHAGCRPDCHVDGAAPPGPWGFTPRKAEPRAAPASPACPGGRSSGHQRPPRPVV